MRVKGGDWVGRARVRIRPPPRGGSESTRSGAAAGAGFEDHESASNEYVNHPIQGLNQIQIGPATASCDLLLIC